MMNKTYKDTDLREALRRKYPDTPRLPADFLESMAERMEQQQRTHRTIKMRRAALALLTVAAAIVLVVLLVKPQQTEPEQPSGLTTHVARDLRPTYIETVDPRSSTPATHVAPAARSKKANRLNKRPVPDRTEERPTPAIPTDNAITEQFVIKRQTLTTNCRVIEIAPNVVMVECKQGTPEIDMQDISVSDIRARGNRLIHNITEQPVNKTKTL